MQFNDSWYWLKDRRYSSYISSRKRDARRENRDLVARFKDGGIASLPAIIRGIEISRSIQEIAAPMEIFLPPLLLALNNRFIFLFFFFYLFLLQEVAMLSKTEMSRRHEIIPTYFRY